MRRASGTSFRGPFSFAVRTPGCGFQLRGYASPRRKSAGNWWREPGALVLEGPQGDRGSAISVFLSEGAIEIRQPVDHEITKCGRSLSVDNQSSPVRATLDAHHLLPVVATPCSWARGLRPAWCQCGEKDSETIVGATGAKLVIVQNWRSGFVCPTSAELVR